MAIPKRLHALALAAVLTLAGGSAQAIPFGNEQGWAEFPAGLISFADAVVDYSPVMTGGQPTAGNQGAFNALGAPDATLDDVCDVATECDSVSLGDGGSITLEFIDNFLSGSGTGDFDLWIFEVGPNIEDTFVEISTDGSVWIAVGTITGATSGIDLDAFGLGLNDLFSYVRLTDDTDQGNQVGPAVGADIDAVGASRGLPGIPQVPEPTTAVLLGLGATLLGVARRRSTR